MKSEIMHPADQICMVMKRIYDQNMTSLTGGNLSIMDEEGVIWVSPSGIDKGSLKREDIVQILPDGTVKGCHKPTSEYRIHRRILQTCPGMRAVVHAHPPALVAMSILYKVPDTSLTIAAYEACDEPGIAEYATPGTMELVECVGKMFETGHDMVVLKNHAAFLGSRVDLFDAVRRFEQLERTAQMQLVAGSSGDLKELKPVQIQAYRESRKYGAGISQTKEYTSFERDRRRELDLFIKRAYEKQLFTGMCGTISARIGRDAFIISPEHRDNAYMTAENLVRIEGGRAEEGKVPDRDWRFHEAVYRLHPEVNCIMMGAPVYVTAYAVSDAGYQVDIAPESYGVLRKEIHIPFEWFVEIEPAAEMLSLEQPFVFIENVGVAAAGPDVTLTFDKMEVAEYSAQSLHMAEINHLDVHILTKEQLRLTDIH